VRMKKYRPAPIKRATSTYVYIKPEIVSRVPARSKAGRRVPFIVVPSVDGCLWTRRVRAHGPEYSALVNGR